jgi:autotransporter-associated beta strand protein
MNALPPANTRAGFRRNSLFSGIAPAFLFAVATHLPLDRAEGAAMTWDSGNTGNGASIDAASGTWDTNVGNIVWNDGITTNVPWTQTSATAPLNSAIFGGVDGTYAITVGTALATSGITFSNSGYTLSAASPQVITTTANVNVASGVSATIGNNVTVAYASNSQFSVGGPGTLTVAAGATISKTGTNNLALTGAGAVFEVNGTIIRTGNGTGSNSLRIGVAAGDLVTVNINAGGTVTHNTSNNRIEIGNGGEATVNVQGGTLQAINGGAILVGAAGTKGTLNLTSGIVSSVNDIVVGNVAEGVLNILGGSASLLGTGTQRLVVGNNGPGTVTLSGTGSMTIASTGGVQFGSAAGSIGAGTLNLDGGTLAAQSIRQVAAGATSIFNFNGGTLRPSVNNANFFTGITNAFVKGGGAIIDTNGFDINIGQNLLADAISTGGGLSKNGNGTLTLSGTSTYTGATTINAGALLVSGSLGDTAKVDVQSGATLGGSGSIVPTSGVTGSVNLLAGAKLSPGVGAGTLTTTLGGGGQFNLSLAVAPVSSQSLTYELGTVGASDKVTLTGGALNIGSGVLAFDDFNFAALGGFAAGTYTLFDGDTSIVGTLDSNPANLTGSIGAFTATLGFADGTNDLVLNVVPEPSSIVSLLGGLGALLGVRRRVSRSRCR